MTLRRARCRSRMVGAQPQHHGPITPDSVSGGVLTPENQLQEISRTNNTASYRFVTNEVIVGRWRPLGPSVIVNAAGHPAGVGRITTIAVGSAYSDAAFHSTYIFCHYVLTTKSPVRLVRAPMSSRSERYRARAEKCRDRAASARTPASKRLNEELAH
jgi:hypothetical protein